MDKYELKVTINEIDSLIARRRFQDAAEVADSVDWRRVKNVRTLCRISDVYKINRRYHDSKRVLELAYAKSPYGRQIIFSLCELELKLGNYVRALQLYNEYINVAPRDVDRYVLQYKLQKAQNVSVNERIAVLEEMARYDFRDKWAFELAKLYLEAGERTLCASECDEIVAFFGYGKYVYKAGRRPRRAGRKQRARRRMRAWREMTPRKLRRRHCLHADRKKKPGRLSPGRSAQSRRRVRERSRHMTPPVRSPKGARRNLKPQSRRSPNYSLKIREKISRMIIR